MSWTTILGGGRLPEPSEVVGYLVSEGWQRVHLVDGRSSVWVSADGAHEAFIPLRSEAADYGSLLLDALTTISRREGRTVGSVTDDMRTTSADVDEREDYEVVGPVVFASSEGGAGEVRINVLLDGRPRKVRVSLTEEDYNRAVHAHARRDQGVLVRCAGDLVKDGRMYRLLSPRRLEVLTPDDE